MLSHRASGWAIRPSSISSISSSRHVGYRTQRLFIAAEKIASSRYASSSSSKRWQTRQSNDKFAKDARVQGLMSRAAFKLLEINEKYRLFKKGQTIVDLGFAPGSWSQVAADRTSPGGRVIGIDIIPTQPPKGVSTIQGNFLSAAVREEVKTFLRDPAQGKLKEEKVLSRGSHDSEFAEEDLEKSSSNYFEPDAAKEATQDEETMQVGNGETAAADRLQKPSDRLVDVVLSDMSAPWEQTTGFQKRSLSDPYYRMMNTSGMSFRDHAGSMDLCNAALLFAYDMLKPGGSFVCKFYQGAEDKLLEQRLRLLFTKVHREKPSSSRSESKEGFFVALKRKRDVTRDAVLE